jgi:3D (Asp-Asp-Asp) domain-containing protein
MIFTEEQLNYVKKCLFLAVFSIIFELGIPHISLAANENLIALSNGYGAPFENSFFGPNPSIDSFDMVISREEKISSPESLLTDYTLSFPNDNDPKVEKEMWITATAYFSDAHYTDATPFTTGWQTPVRDGVVAINFLPKGTIVRFPDMFGDKIFIVEDSMNARYTYRADIWMETLAEAKQFGIKYIRMEIMSVQLPRDYVLDNYEPAFPGKK